MDDPTLFTSGALFTLDFLKEGIRHSPEYAAVDLPAVKAALAKIAGGFPHASKPNEATTEKDFVWPVLAALGWTDFLTQQNLSGFGRLDVPDALLFIDAAAKAKANAFPDEAKRYGFGAAVLEAKRWGRALDRAEGRKGDDKDTPSTQLLRYLRRVDDLSGGGLRWGILTNGARWRLYYAGAQSPIDGYLDLDLARIIGLETDLLDTGIGDSERDHWLAVFVAMFARTAFARAGDKAPSFHDVARREAGFYEERVAKSLSDKVFGDLYPALGKAVAKAAPADTSLDDVRQATLILLYRLLFVLYAEDRGLLPVSDPRFDDYALRKARLDVGERMDRADAFSSVATPIWGRFASLAAMIDKGDPSVGLPPYNGGLFNGEQTPLLKSIALADDVMAHALDVLSFEQHAGRRRYINYRDLSVQQLGSIYERLLEFELIRDAAGDVEIRPNIFARKNSGSYYTPDDLVRLILDETLEPLIADAHAAFEAALGQLKPGDSEEYKLTWLQKADPAKAITRLRICDPAMGSGHFLVSLVDKLANLALEAIEDARILARENAGMDDYESPVAEEIRKVRGTIRGHAHDEGWAVSEEQLDDPQLVKRMVLKRCVYGADKNPMAVELAKVALWLHTFTVGAPLSFIDHHLAAGDSLFGLWVRDAIDKAGKGGELLYIEDLRTAERQASVMQRIEALTDAEIAEAQSSADMWRDVEMQVGPFDSFVSFIHALDWLDLKGPDKALVSLWLDGRFGDPIPIARGRKVPEGGKAKPEELERFTAIWEQARALIEEERFLNWQIAFPGVWKNWAGGERDGGFDAVVGNPPWDRFEFEEVPWFEARNRSISLELSGAKRKARIKALEAQGDPLWRDYKFASERLAAGIKIVRSGTIYSRLNVGKLNVFKLFVERAFQLAKPNGMVGMLMPSGIAADQSSSGFFREVATKGHLKSLFDFENKQNFFPDVDSRFKFCTLVGSPSRKFSAASCGFFLQNVSDTLVPNRVFPITAAEFAKVNPNTGTAPIFRTHRDMALVTAIYGRLPVLIDRSSGASVSAWPVRYAQMLNVTSDSHQFRTRLEMEETEGAWSIGGNLFQSAAGKWVPLYEGKMVQAYDHRAASVVINEANLKRPAQPEPASQGQLTDPTWLPTPQFWVSESAHELIKLEWTLSYKIVSSPTNMRTLIGAVLPRSGVGNSMGIVVPAVKNSPFGQIGAKLLANFNSLVFDFVLRQKIQGQNVNWFIVEQLPVVPPEAYAMMFGPKSATEIVREVVLELTYTAHDMAPFARDMGHVDTAGEVLPPFVWDEDRRLRLRAKLDALYFILYGIFDPADPERSRDDVRYIYSTFPIVERQERAAYGSYRSRDLALAWINALMAGQPDADVAG